MIGEGARRVGAVSAGLLLFVPSALLLAILSMPLEIDTAPHQPPPLEAGLVLLTEPAPAAAPPPARIIPESHETRPIPAAPRPAAIHPAPIRARTAPARPLASPAPPPPLATATATATEPEPEPEQRDNTADNSAARAILQPLPELPPEMRRHLLDLVVLVRFEIAEDGRAVPELEKATPDPALNRILLDCFRRWRFFPAIHEGRPTASELRLRIPIRVE